MKRCTPLLAAVVLMAGAAPRDDANAVDLKKMQGDWVVVSMVKDGTKIPDDDAQALFRTVKDDTYAVARFSRVIGKGTFKIDATKKPKTIDSTPAGSGDKAPPILGIYELDGDRLKICNAPPGKDRPTDFDAKEGSEHTLIIWQREKK
jgi:uncharacterized protein (TIGR03067 family)